METLNQIEVSGNTDNVDSINTNNANVDNTNDNNNVTVDNVTVDNTNDSNNVTVDNTINTDNLNTDNLNADNTNIDNNLIELYENNDISKNSRLSRKMKNCWNTFLNMKWNTIINFITMFIFVGCYTMSFLTVPGYNGKMNTGIIIGITIIFTMVFTKQFGYVIDVYKNRKINDIQWNIDHIRWNSFLLLFITFGSILSICFFMVQTKSLEIYNDIISQFDVLQTVVFSFDIILYIILISFISYHLTFHINNIKKINEVKMNEMV